MKRKIVTFILSLGIIFSLSACGETVKNNYGEEVQKYGPYVEISHNTGKSVYGEKLTFYNVYDRETKEMFEIIIGNSRSFSIRQIWDYDEEGHPIVKYYEGE